MRASYYSSVSLHSELIASGVIMTDLGSVLTCLTNVDNSIWIVLLNGWGDSCLSLPIFLALINLPNVIILVEDISNPVHVMLFLTVPCAASPYHFIPSVFKSGSIETYLRCYHQTSQSWRWLWPNATMNPKKLQLFGLSEAISTTYCKRVILTGGK